MAGVFSRYVGRGTYFVGAGYIERIILLFDMEGFSERLDVLEDKEYGKVATAVYSIEYIV